MSADPTPVSRRPRRSSRPTRPAKRLSSLGGRTPGLISGCAKASSSCLTAPSCSRCERREATGDSLWRCSKTSPSAATDSHWFSMGHLKSTYRELLIAAHRETGEYKIPH